MRAKTVGILAACVALAALQYPLWFADDGLAGLFRAQKDVAEQDRKNAELRERNRRLAAEVEDLKQGDEEIERLARSELGMIGPGEKIYLLVEEPAEPESTEPGDPPGGARE